MAITSIIWSMVIFITRTMAIATTTGRSLSSEFRYRVLSRRLLKLLQPPGRIGQDRVTFVIRHFPPAPGLILRSGARRAEAGSLVEFADVDAR
jgi:hypothetical protein